MSKARKHDLYLTFNYHLKTIQSGKKANGNRNNGVRSNYMHSLRMHCSRYFKKCIGFMGANTCSLNGVLDRVLPGVWRGRR